MCSEAAILKDPKKTPIPSTCFRFVFYYRSIVQLSLLVPILKINFCFSPFHEDLGFCMVYAMYIVYKKGVQELQNTFGQLQSVS